MEVGRGTAEVNGLIREDMEVEVKVRIVLRRGTVREKGGKAEIGSMGRDGRSFFLHKSPTVSQGQYRTLHSHPLISRPLPINSQPLEGQIRLPNHTSSKSTLPQLRCV